MEKRKQLLPPAVCRLMCVFVGRFGRNRMPPLPLLLSVHFTILYVLVVLLVALFFSFLFFSLLILSHDRLSLVYNTARVEIRKGKKK